MYEYSIYSWALEEIANNVMQFVNEERKNKEKLNRLSKYGFHLTEGKRAFLEDLFYNKLVELNNQGMLFVNIPDVWKRRITYQISSGAIMRSAIDQREKPVYSYIDGASISALEATIDLVVNDRQDPEPVDATPQLNSPADYVHSPPSFVDVKEQIGGDAYEVGKQFRATSKQVLQKALNPDIVLADAPNETAPNASAENPVTGIEQPLTDPAARADSRATGQEQPSTVQPLQNFSLNPIPDSLQPFSSAGSPLLSQAVPMAGDAAAMTSSRDSATSPTTSQITSPINPTIIDALVQNPALTSGLVRPAQIDAIVINALEIANGLPDGQNLTVITDDPELTQQLQNTLDTLAQSEDVQNAALAARIEATTFDADPATPPTADTTLGRIDIAAAEPAGAAVTYNQWPANLDGPVLTVHTQSSLDAGSFYVKASRNESGRVQFSASNNITAMNRQAAQAAFKGQEQAWQKLLKNHNRLLAGLKNSSKFAGLLLLDVSMLSSDQQQLLQNYHLENSQVIGFQSLTSAQKRQLNTAVLSKVVGDALQTSGKTKVILRVNATALLNHQQMQKRLNNGQQILLQTGRR